MSEPAPQNDYLVLSRRQWDEGASKADIAAAIEKFYAWYEGNLQAGRFRPGSRLGTEGAVVAKSGAVMDGPYGETKEVVGGYWFIVAESLRAAAQLAAQNPCAQLGLTFELRPLEAARASVYNVTNETPAA